LGTRKPPVATGSKGSTEATNYDGTGDVIFFDMLIEWLEGYGLPLMALSVSVVYFFASPHSQPVGRRIVASAHGLSICCLYAVAMGGWRLGLSGKVFGYLFSFLLFVPLFLIALSFSTFAGRKGFHWFQLLNLIRLAWVAFIGSMASSGDWL
jgi:hypothetical protein